MTIYKACDNWLQSRRNYIRNTTYISYEYAIKRFKHYFSDCSVGELTREVVIECFRAMALENSHSSIYAVRQVLRAVYQQLIERDLANKNPFSKVPIPYTASKKTVEAYTLEEQQKIISACHLDKMGDCFIFLLLTGLRLSEFVSLRWSDYNPQEHTIAIRRSKTSAGATTLSLSRKAESILTNQEQRHQFVFSNCHGEPVSVTSMKKFLSRLKKATGISNLTNHKCRHTFCTRLVQAGVDIRTVSSLARHTSVAFTLQHYVTCDKRIQREALERLDAVI